MGRVMTTQVLDGMDFRDDAPCQQTHGGTTTHRLSSLVALEIVARLDSLFMYDKKGSDILPEGRGILMRRGMSKIN